MAGTLPGIPLSQQFSAIGQPLAGCLLYIYAANTTTPQDSFLDQGLAIKSPWPLAGDNSGRVPMFYLADGSVHVRLTDATGVVQFDYPSMMVVGPSSGGGGGGGGSVDPAAIFQTGDVMWLDQPGPRTGWVRDNGRTIGNAVSGASERANADCQALFIFGWQRPGFGAVVGGAGASGLADFTAGKQLPLPDKRGFSIAGDTAMGNADTGRLASVPFIAGNPTTPGSWAGEAAHTLATGEMPSHAHPAFIFDPTHHHNITNNVNQWIVNVGSGLWNGGGGGSPSNPTIDFQATGVRVWDGTNFDTTNPVGGNGPHNNTPLIFIGTYFRKL